MSEEQQVIPPAQEETQEAVQISKLEYEFLQKMAIDIGAMSASIDKLVKHLAPLIPKTKEGKKPNVAMIAANAMKNLDKIIKVAPAIGIEIQILNPLYKKYIRLNEHSNSKHNTERVHSESE